MRNKFDSPKFIEHVIVDDEDKKLGTLRIKPSGVSWKPASKQAFYSVPLSKFTAWITDPETKANVVKS